MCFYKHLALKIVQSLSHVWLFATLWTVETQAPLFSTISQRLLKFMSIKSVMLSNHLILFCSLLLCLQSFPSSEPFAMSQLFTSGGQSLGASVSATALPMNIQDSFSLGLTGLISCNPRDSEESSPAPRFESNNSLTLSHLYCSTLMSVHDYWKNQSFDYTYLYQQLYGNSSHSDLRH